MSSAARHLSRRTLLRGTGVALGLPLLEAMVPGGARAARTAGVDRGVARLAYIYLPGELAGRRQMSAEVGANVSVPSLQALADVHPDVSICSAVTIDPSGELTGLARCAAFMQVPATQRMPGRRGAIGATADQIAATHLGRGVRRPSLQLATGSSEFASHCPSDRGPLDHMSWQSATSPRPGESSPRAVFHRLFGGADDSQRPLSGKSVLDRVEGRRRLVAKLGVEDRRRLEAYFEAIRQVEQQIESVESDLASCRAAEVVPGTWSKAEDPPIDVAQARLLCDLLVLAYQADATRVATLQFRWPTGLCTGDAYVARRRVTIALVGELLAKLAATPSGHSSLLEQSCLMIGSGEYATIQLALAGGMLREQRRHLAGENTTLPEVHQTILARALA